MKFDYYDLITKNLMSPERLEFLFRESPLEFASAFEKVYRDNPGSQILEVWKARLDYNPKPRKPKNGKYTSIVISLLILLGGLFLQIPVSFLIVNDLTVFQGTFIPAIIVLSTSITFISYFKFDMKISILVILLIGLSAVYLNLGLRYYGDSSQIPLLVILHVILFMWTVVGLAYVGREYRDPIFRADFLSITGEMIIYGAIIGACFMLFGGLLALLFNVVGLEIVETIFKNIYMPVILTVVLVAAAFALSNFGIRKMIPYLAKIFGALVLISLAIFIFVMVFSSENPYQNREFLLVFNIVLIFVLAILFFIITERRGRGYRNFFDYVNLILAIIAAIIDLIALSAIIYRLALYQLTPNRLAVIGANIIILVNLIDIIINYFKFIRGRAPITDSIKWIGLYLPIYAFWFSIVAFLFPLIFGL